MNQPTRADLLVDLADAVNELVEPRATTEHVEVTITETQPSANGRRRKAKRTRRRRAHHVTLPSLLDSLQDAMIPGAAGEPGAPSGFESRTPSELDATSVLRNIHDDVARYARVLGISRKPLADTLRALVSADTSDALLANLAADARSWVRQARLATGYDAAPITLSDPCPYCFRRNSLTITGDLQAAHCTRCGTRWNPYTIGLLADMLTTNQTQETAAAVPCWMPDCIRVGPHNEHADNRGHTWRDSCELDTPTNPKT